MGRGCWFWLCSARRCQVPRLSFKASGRCGSGRLLTAMKEEATFQKLASMAASGPRAVLTPVAAHGCARRFGFSDRPNWVSVSADRAVSLQISTEQPHPSFLPAILILPEASPVNQRSYLRYLSGHRHHRSVNGSLGDGIRQWKIKRVLGGLGRSALLLDGGTDR